MGAQKQPQGGGQRQIRPELEAPKELPRPKPKEQASAGAVEPAPEPEKKRRHPLVEAGISLLKIPFKVFVEWPLDAIDWAEQKRLDRKNREVMERAERQRRLNEMFPQQEKPRKHGEK